MKRMMDYVTIAFAQTDWGWITNNGLAVGLLIAIGLGTWRVLTWTGTNVVLPMKDSAIKHLDETNKTLKSNAEATGALTSMISNLHADVKEIKAGVNCKFKRDL